MRQWAGGANGAVYYYVTELPGHVAGLLDSSDNLVNQYRYRPFGKLEYQKEGTLNPLRFQAREIDGTTGLYYFRNRWYDPELARFLSEDPTGLEGGINPYAFAENNPVNFTDPLGLAPILIEGVTVIAAADQWEPVCRRGTCRTRGGTGSDGMPGQAGRRSGARQPMPQTANAKQAKPDVSLECARSLIQIADFIPFGAIPFGAPAPQLFNVHLEFSAAAALSGDIASTNVAGWRKGIASLVLGAQYFTIVTGSNPVTAVPTSVAELLLAATASWALNGTPNFYYAAAKTCGWIK